MNTLRAVPVALAIAGLLTSSLALAGTTPGVAPTTDATVGPGVGMSEDGRAAAHQGLLATPTRVLGVRASGGHISDLMRRADAAWARGDKKEACRWANAAQGTWTADPDVRNAVDEYCADDTGHDAHDTHSG